jgi:hypothetical protein
MKKRAEKRKSPPTESAGVKDKLSKSERAAHTEQLGANALAKQTEANEG